MALKKLNPICGLETNILNGRQIMKRVVIIGGGVAGLSAASMLVRSGCDVTLLEAKKRCGGRINTVLHEGAIVELGAEFLHGESAAITNAIRAAGLTTHLISEDYQLFQDGHFQRINFWNKMSKIIHRIDIHQRDCSVEEFLDSQNLGLDDYDQATGFVQSFHAARTYAMSAHSLRRLEYSAEHMQNTRQARINEGYGALVDFLTNEIQDHGVHVIVGAPVQKVRWQRGQIEVTFQQGEEQTLRADAAVVTLPLGVLKFGSVEFQPPLAVKNEAIQQLQFGNVVKIIFQFRKKWWPDFGFILNLHEAFPTWWTDPRGLFLTAWVGGPKADLLFNRTPAELEKMGLEILVRMFPNEAEQISEQFILSLTFDWANDPFTRGAYSYMPVNGLDLPKLLGASVADTLFFAGEATVADAQTGTVFGAFETGLRAARELLAMLDDTSADS